MLVYIVRCYTTKGRKHEYAEESLWESRAEAELHKEFCETRYDYVELVRERLEVGDLR